MDPIGNLVSLHLSIQEANISMNRLSEIIDYEREQKSERQYQEKTHTQTSRNQISVISMV